MLSSHSCSQRRRWFSVAVLAGIAAVALFVLSGTGTVLATANYVYHEQTENFVNGSNGYKYFQTSGGHGTTPWSSDTVYPAFKVEYQFWTNQVRLYYTTDGSTPAGSFGTGSGTTAVQTCTYSATFGSPVVDVVTCPGIPPQAKGTTVKYILSAWHSDGGDEIFANSGSCNSSSCATGFSYQTLGPTAVTLASLSASSAGFLSTLPALAAAGMVLALMAVAFLWRRRQVVQIR